MLRFPLFVLTAPCLFGSSAKADDYGYPYRDPYLATATTAILDGDGFAHRPDREVVHVPGLPADMICLFSKDAAN